MTAASGLRVRLERIKSDLRPEHHIPPPLPAAAVWASYLGWSKHREDNAKPPARNGSTGFHNPWPSFHKATKQELWQALEWGEDADPTIELAASHLAGHATTSRPTQATQLLQTDKPDLSFAPENGVRAKTTWLGHAGLLLQLPPVKQGGDPIRIIFDPIFSHRSSPYQNVGPVRSYKPPCRLEDLPSINVLVISHNHFDHLDYETVLALWRLNKSSMRIVVPLNNARWFINNCGITEESITELDWWESVYFTEGEGLETAKESGQLKITCTPAQHSSVREGRDADLALWASWFLTHEEPPSSDSQHEKPYRVFFAGDSGYQFHSDSAWPPRPPPGTTHQQLSAGTIKKVADPDNVSSSKEKYPPCPAYKEIAARLGTPDLVYLPVALGATWAYIRSFFSNYVPAPAVPVPRHSSGVTGAIHMPPWDAVRVLRDLMSSNTSTGRPPVAVAMHWGTFVTEPVEILKTLGQLEWACYNQGVRFGRSLEEAREAESETEKEQPLFLALNHGQSILT